MDGSEEGGVLLRRRDGSTICLHASISSRGPLLTPGVQECSSPSHLSSDLQQSIFLEREEKSFQPCKNSETGQKRASC